MTPEPSEEALLAEGLTRLGQYAELQRSILNGLQSRFLGRRLTDAGIVGAMERYAMHEVDRYFTNVHGFWPPPIRVEIKVAVAGNAQIEVVLHEVDPYAGGA